MTLGLIQKSMVKSPCPKFQSVEIGTVMSEPDPLKNAEPVPYLNWAEDNVALEVTVLGDRLWSAKSVSRGSWSLVKASGVLTTP